ncbi:hypothetical protein V2J09_013872 [Rumex salicifolius]
MDFVPFHDGNIASMIDARLIDLRHDDKHSLQMHSSLIKRLALDEALEGHTGCVNTIAWNSQGSLLISGSDDQSVNIWSYSTRKLLHSMETGHFANIFCTKFLPDTSDELVASGAGDCEVRVFNVARSSERSAEVTPTAPLAHFQCHTKRVKKLAVEVGNPHVVWSASEDGTLRQHDLRECCSCPSAGSTENECRNILLDLRCGEKRSLSDPPNGTLNLKSCEISITRPHLLLVGGSDAFARLYDRRMLPPLSSSQKRLSPPPCVNYYCPMHLSVRRGRSLHLTHVTFSPCGEEVLISYSGEHVYLFDINQGIRSSVQYASGDVTNQWTISPNLNGIQPTVNLDEISSRKGKSNGQCLQQERYRKLLQTAENCLNEGSNYYYGIEACNEVLYGHNLQLDPMLRHDCLCVRASLLLKRKWKNDAHMAVRDLNEARKVDSSSFRVLYCMSEALVELDKHKEALIFALAAQCLVPSSEVAERIESIKKHLSAVDAVKSDCARDEAPRAESQRGRVISLSNLFSRSVASNDASQEGPGSEREDSDDDEEELELDFETSVSGDEELNDDSDVLHGSLNLRIQRRDREAGCSSNLSASESTQNEKATYKPEQAVDMKRRYVGHCNMGTDIKQASFLGQKGEYVASGSDDGRWFIWEKKTSRLIKMFIGDEAVVNCIQCHPFDSVVATSGIDNTIKLWSPTAANASMVSSAIAGPQAADPVEAMESNQRSLSRARGPFVPFEILERLGMPDSFEGSFGNLQGVQVIPPFFD